MKLGMWLLRTSAKLEGWAVWRMWQPSWERVLSDTRGAQPADTAGIIYTSSSNLLSTPEIASDQSGELTVRLQLQIYKLIYNTVRKQLQIASDQLGELSVRLQLYA